MSYKFKNNSLYIYIVIFMALFCLWPANSRAQDAGPSISIVPHTFDLTVQPGEQKSDKLKVYNKGEVAIPFKLKIVEFSARDVTGEMIINEEQLDEKSPQNWIEFEKQDFVVDAQEKEVVNFTIKVPQDAEPQGYYAMVLFEADISTLYFNESRLQVVPNMGVLFMLKVAGGDEPEEPLSLLEYSVLDDQKIEGMEKVVNFLAQPFVEDDQQISVIGSAQPMFLVKIKNNDLYHKKLSGNVTLSGVGWKVEGELGVQPVTILPGMTREILVKGASVEGEPEDGEWFEETENKGSFGLVQADLQINEQDGFSKHQSKWILVFSWKIVAIFLSLLGLFFMALKLFRKKTKGENGGKGKKKQKKNSKWGLFRRKKKVAKKKEKQPEKKPAEVPSIEEVDISSIDNSKLLAILKQEKQQMKRNLRYLTFKAIPIKPEEGQKEKKVEISEAKTPEKKLVTKRKAGRKIAKKGAKKKAVAKKIAKKKTRKKASPKKVGPKRAIKKK